MKSLFSFALAVFIIFNVSAFKVHAYENKSIQNKSQILIARKYAEIFCSAKEDHFFEGLENEKTLKYSYFKYIGLQNEEMISKDLYRNLINQIREKCTITNEEESEMNKYILKAKK